MSLTNMYDYVSGEFYSATDLQQPITGSGIVKVYDNEDADVSLAFSSITIYTGAGQTGTQLVLDTDFTLQIQDPFYTSAESINIYKGIQITNISYQGVTLYINGNILGGFISKNYIDVEINNTRSYVDTKVNDRIPIGFIYHQLPTQSAPATLFGGTWENVSSSYAGDFFRAEGGNASTFESGTQTHQFEDHAHNHRHNVYTDGGGSGHTVCNSIYDDAYTNEGAVTTYTAANPSSGNHGSETRPVNKTIRIWRRTA